MSTRKKNQVVSRDTWSQVDKELHQYIDRYIDPISYAVIVFGFSYFLILVLFFGLTKIFSLAKFTLYFIVGSVAPTIPIELNGTAYEAQMIYKIVKKTYWATAGEAFGLAIPSLVVATFIYLFIWVCKKYTAQRQYTGGNTHEHAKR